MINERASGEDSLIAPAPSYVWRRSLVVELLSAIGQSTGGKGMRAVVLVNSD
jgi:hypothetical protein